MARVFVRTYSNTPNLFMTICPADFDRQTYLSIAKQLKIAEKTADKYIKSFLSQRHGKARSARRYSKSNS
jgi:hypothetical protein